MRNEYSECNRVGRLKAPTAYHPMSRLSDNLTARRKQLGLTVPQVHAALQLMGVDVAKPTVYGWFNGNRGFQNMDHLEAVCKRSEERRVGKECDSKCRSRRSP